eukprot:2276382-Ditylum_brightwellii.AAC.1
MKLAVKFLFAHAALGVMVSASDITQHLGIGFSTEYMSVKPTFDTVTNKVVPNLQNTLGISNFRIYNANEEAEYIATLIKENNDITFIVDT